jgi:rhamnosyltransferase
VINLIKPRVCVLLATFNGAAFLEEQLASILGQIGVDIEVFVRDDGSSDGTLLILSSWRERDCRVHLVDDFEVGATGSPTKSFFRLFGNVTFTGFDFVALSDQDDIWLPSKILSLVRKLEQSGADGGSSNLISYFSDGRVKLLQKSGVQSPVDYLFQGASAGCTYVLRSRFAIKVAERFGEASAISALPLGASHDWLIYALCRGTGGHWVMEHTPHILYRQHSRNAYGAQAGAVGLLSRLRLARSGWYFRQVLFLESVVPVTQRHRQIFLAVRRLSAFDRMWLALNCRSFRRERRDAFLLAVFLLLSRRI